MTAPTHATEEALARHPFLAGLDPRLLREIAPLAREVRFADGAYLLRDGEDARVVYLVAEGCVSLETKPLGRPAVRVESVEGGSVVGLSWMFPPYRVHLDARAVGEVVAIAIDAARLRAAMEHHPALGCAIRTRLLATTFERLQRVRMQRLDLYGEGPR